MFLEEPPLDDAVAQIYRDTVDEAGYISNYARAWAWQPHIWKTFTEARSAAAKSGGLSARELAVLIAAVVSGISDSYCSLAWGSNLSRESDEDIAAAVIGGRVPDELTEREAALVKWGRKVSENPLGTTADEVAELKALGFSDGDIFAITALVAFRIAFSSINAAMGVNPDLQLAHEAPVAVREAVAFGRPVASEPSAIA